VIDSHCHLADEAFAGDLADVAARAQAAGVTRALCILSADEDEELVRAEAVTRSWPAVVFSTGIHPHRAGPYGGRLDVVDATVAAAIDRVQAVALGEIGLDYHYDFAPRDVQRAVFGAQLQAAGHRRLPVVIHTREASEDTYAVIREAGGSVRGVMHCFTGSADDARAALDLGFYLSLAGVVTFANAAALRGIAGFIPADRLLVETDAPFLAPVPRRGRRNEPAWVTDTLHIVAGVRGVEPRVLGEQIASNFDEFVRRGPI
jgi:TatD DNase family protein